MKAQKYKKFFIDKIWLHTFIALWLDNIDLEPPGYIAS